MTKQELAAICIARLKAEYPDSDCTLDYDHAWQLLVSVRLAAQCILPSVYSGTFGSLVFL